MVKSQKGMSSFYCYVGNSLAKRTKAIIILLCTSVMTLTLYYPDLWRYPGQTYADRSPLGFVYYENNSEYLISTLGCHIPRVELKFTNAVASNPSAAAKVRCGIPLVSVSKDAEGHVELKVITSSLSHYFKKTSDFSHCCYIIVTRVKDNDKKISRSSCHKFRDTTRVEGTDEFLSVKCFGKNGARVFDDNLAVLRRKPVDSDAENSWSVLVLGVDTMSRIRLHHDMPATAEYFRRNNWIDFKGYQKVADNTFPNLMAVLTGNNDSFAYGSCQSRINECNKLMLWSFYKNNKYVTAYGEDDLRLPDTFSRSEGFIQPPTDHYMRPFFLIGEKERKIDKFNVVCSGSKMTGEHIIDYASDFAQTYINQSSFGFFWMNSFSHNPENSPLVMDSKITSVLETLTSVGVMNKTFVIFLSDHGIRFGTESRKQVEAYYEERLPSLLMWVPTHFRETFPEIYETLRINTLRLVTPYDLYMTLQDILHHSTNGSEYQIKSANGCTECKSLFQEVPIGRTCKNASVSDKWCTCHKLEAAELSRRRVAIESIDFAIRHINNHTKQSETEKCSYCAKVRLKNIIRMHYYKDLTDKDKTFYVVAFSVTPGDSSYEVTVSQHRLSGFEVVGSISMISRYKGNGGCAIKNNYRALCHCLYIRELTKCAKKYT